MMISIFRKALFPVLVLGLGLLTGCSPDGAVSEKLKPTPTAFGNINQLALIADSSLMTSELGDSLLYYYASAYPIMPQPEPIFDIVFKTPEDLRAQPVLQELRSYLIVGNLNDRQSTTTRMIENDISDAKLEKARQEGFGTAVARDKWAKGQLLIYVFGKNREELLRGLITSFPAVAKRFNDRDLERIDATTYFNGENREVMDIVRIRLGADIRVPKSFQLTPTEDSTVVWLRKDIPEGSMNILMTKVLYEDQRQLSKSGIKSIRDSIGRRYIASTAPNTYMKINDVDLPMFSDVTSVNGDYALEARGIWEMENDFMAGPFVSYLIHDPDRRELLFLDGFVYRPNEDKRNLVQELEYILRTTKF
jgi:hypothetical protein